MRSRIGPPSTFQYSKGPRSGKILMGRKCVPVFMKQEGTHAGGRKPKRAPEAHSAMRLTNADMLRMNRKADPDYVPLHMRKHYNQILSRYFNNLTPAQKITLGPGLKKLAMEKARERYIEDLRPKHTRPAVLKYPRQMADC